MKKQDLKQERQILYESWDKYRGKHVLIIGEKIFSASTGEEALKLFKKIEKENPNRVPLIAYIPKEDTLIWVSLCEMIFPHF